MTRGQYLQSSQWVQYVRFQHLSKELRILKSFMKIFSSSLFMFLFSYLNGDYIFKKLFQALYGLIHIYCHPLPACVFPYLLSKL